jgi:hypothetical protein
MIANTTNSKDLKVILLIIINFLKPNFILVFHATKLDKFLIGKYKSRKKIP